jgi:hypothetical protein
MKAQVSFKVMDPDFNQEYADQYHGGNESESNWKYLWASTYQVEEVKSVAIIENEDFVLSGQFADGEKFSFNIPNVHTFRCYLADGSREDFSVSKSILNKTHQAKKEPYDVTRFYFYINASPASHKLHPNLVIDEKYIPRELLVK